MTADNLVLTPGGYRDRSLVHYVAPGQMLRLEGERLFLVDAKTQAAVAIPDSKEKATSLDENWIAFAGWTNDTGAPLSQFSTTWQVPPQPARSFAQTIFLFNGMQPPSGRSILQPVLQWGAATAGAAGVDSAWVAGCWYVTPGGHAFYADSVVVQPGQRLTGVMTVTGRPGNNFSYDCQFAEFPGTRLSVQNIPELTWCCETLETYQIQQCADYPDTPSTRFSNIQVDNGNYPGPIRWKPKVNFTECGQRVDIVNNSSTSGVVDIYYRNN